MPNKSKTEDSATLQSLDRKIDRVGHSVDHLTKVVEGLAISTKKGFDSIAERFTKVDSRLFNLEGDMSETKARLGRIEEKLTTGNYEGRLESVEEDVDKLKTRAGIR